MRVFDGFAGTGSSTQAFYDAGHEVVFLENDHDLCQSLRSNYPKAHVLEMDIKKFAANPFPYLEGLHGRSVWLPDVAWESPPCKCFSMAGSGSKQNGSTRWDYADEGMEFQFFGPRFPQDQEARIGCSLVLAALEVIRKLEPKWFWIENPMGGLKTMKFMEKVPGPVIVTYCQYGDKRMKPTTLWGRWPEEWNARPRCYNGMPCHEAAPRGAKTGTQGIDGARDRARVPYQLSDDIRKACEAALSKL